MLGGYKINNTLQFESFIKRENIEKTNNCQFEEKICKEDEVSNNYDEKTENAEDNNTNSKNEEQDCSNHDYIKKDNDTGNVKSTDENAKDSVLPIQDNNSIHSECCNNENTENECSNEENAKKVYISQNNVSNVDFNFTENEKEKLKNVFDHIDDNTSDSEYEEELSENEEKDTNEFDKNQLLNVTLYCYKSMYKNVQWGFMVISDGIRAVTHAIIYNSKGKFLLKLLHNNYILICGNSIPENMSITDKEVLLELKQKSEEVLATEVIKYSHANNFSMISLKSFGKISTCAVSIASYNSLFDLTADIYQPVNYSKLGSCSNEEKSILQPNLYIDMDDISLKNLKEKLTNIS